MQTRRPVDDGRQQWRSVSLPPRRRRLQTAGRPVSQAVVHSLSVQSFCSDVLSHSGPRSLCILLLLLRVQLLCSFTYCLYVLLETYVQIDGDVDLGLV